VGQVCQGHANVLRLTAQAGGQVALEAAQLDLGPGLGLGVRQGVHVRGDAERLAQEPAGLVLARVVDELVGELDLEARERLTIGLLEGVVLHVHVGHEAVVVALLRPPAERAEAGVGLHVLEGGVEGGENGLDLGVDRHSKLLERK